MPQSTPSGNVIFRQYLGNGSTDFSYQFKRTWQARANYRRGVEYVVDIPEPVFADSVGIGIDGFLTRRIDLAVWGGYSSSSSLLNSSALVFDSYGGSLRVRYGLTRLAATYVRVPVYYFYAFADGILLPIGYPRELERHGARVGFTLWMPALRK